MQTQKGCWCCREDSHPAALPKLPFALSWWEAVRVLLDRQWKLTVRDGALVRGRIIQVSQPLPLHSHCLQPSALWDSLHTCGLGREAFQLGSSDSAEAALSSSRLWDTSVVVAIRIWLHATYHQVHACLQALRS